MTDLSFVALACGLIIGLGAIGACIGIGIMVAPDVRRLLRHDRSGGRDDDSRVRLMGNPIDQIPDSSPGFEPALDDAQLSARFAVRAEREVRALAGWIDDPDPVP